MAQDKSLIRRLIDFLVGVESEQETTEGQERSMSINDLFMQVWALLQVNHTDAYINDLYVDENGATFAVVTSRGKLYRAAVEVADNTVSVGELQEVVIEFVPRSRMSIIRSNGQVRALIVAASAVLNRVGEIDSRDLFDSFAEHIERTGQHPEYGFYHLWEEEHGFGDFRLGVVDWVGREGNLYLASVLFDDTELARAAIKSIEDDPDYWGNSIGFMASGNDCDLLDTGGGVTIPVYKRGRNHEISLLPEKRAAAWFTRVDIAQERAIVMNEKEREAFLKLFSGNEEQAERFLASARAVDRSITEQGLITRQKQGDADSDEEEDAPEGEQEKGAPTTVTLEPLTIELDEEAASEIATLVLESDTVRALVGNIQALQTEVDELKRSLSAERQQTASRLASLEETDDQKRARYQEDMPRKGTQRATFRPREQRRDSGPAPTPEQEEEAIVGNALSKIPKY